MNDKTLPKLPHNLQIKLYKTGQTRGADDDVIYQNRVRRNSTVLIPYSEWKHKHAVLSEMDFENGYIVLLPPNLPELKLQECANLHIGENCLYFYETRQDWEQYNPEKRHFHVAKYRKAPLGGQYVARVPATTAAKGEKIQLGYLNTKMKGAGIRFFEYAGTQTIGECKLQLEAIFWHCYDAMEAVVAAGMSKEDADKRKRIILEKCQQSGLLEYERMIGMRILDRDKVAICPFCLSPISGHSFMTKISQMEGREVQDLTVTEISLFHIEELRPGLFNHRPYNLGWGHHHCNVIVKDSGILPTLAWLREVIQRNIDAGVVIP